MRKKLLLLSAFLIFTTLWRASLSLAATCSVVVSGAGTFSTGSNVTLTSAFSGTCQQISQVSYFNGATTPATLLGSSSVGPTYSFAWNTSGVPVGTYNNIFAVADFTGTASGSGGATVIDVVGSAASGPNPAQNASFGGAYAGSWLPGDNQMCTTAWPYNGADSNFTDGTCEWTGSTTAPPPPNTPLTAPTSSLDGLDDVMHTLSDFELYAQTFLGSDAGTLSSTFQTWYPQAAAWIDPASNGRLIPLPGQLNGWNTLITNWLNQTYISANAWCMPTESTLLNGNPATTEDAYINSNSNGSAVWGDLPHVIACMNYNSNQTPTVGYVYNFQQCATALSSGVCPAALPAQCAASSLGRSLLGVAAPAYDGCAGNYMTWVNNSLTLATDEAPKFALRGAFLTDIYNRADTMQTIFPAAATAIQNFLNGPAAQLIAANGQTPPTQSLPNAVIYGWVDNTYPNGQPGYAHIVKVTAYSPGRCGGICSSTFIDSILPWIKTTTSGFLDLTRSYTLTDRDDYVYVSVKRWDEDHGSIFFPNGHPLWQNLMHNPSGGSSATTTGQGLLASCIGPGGFGFGLEPQTVAGLIYTGISPADQTAMSNAFMLNDEGDGKVDPSGVLPAYGACMTAANALLTNAPESHACVEYIASRNALGPSGDGDADYSMKFVTCPSIPPEDLGSS